ncbi:MAG: CDP-glucose 4,6-dehydratase [Verrucomicrobia bacterium RIFCSPHIGHO2_12_FULL_41_10]|nr:MAG: CDP-glucose 4,6-dehydratase [Verrucomicrobia bacterium RIFCSPHIGHO2_12_FULL_41_10]HLB33095.1 CDP-glucose 4,6-dehydratase [Chthoniobacterales bacterium]
MFSHNTFAAQSFGSDPSSEGGGLNACFAGAYAGKKVWLSGHTGFKGAWLAEWLLLLGAEVYGYALKPPSTPSLFDQLDLGSRLHHHISDIRDRVAVRESILSFQPDFVFHLAAQPLVRYSYAEPVETYETNVLGTIHVLEALRELRNQSSNARSIAAVMVTTDKCYENREHGLPYTEEDALGGFDPYSSSKAMAEIAIAAYRRSYFSEQSLICLASARAGNVIGGGDWAEDRIIPDALRALEKGDSIAVRNPLAIRPWQHVLEPLSGYLWLGARLMKDPTLATAFNFGPTPQENYCVKDVVSELLQYWPGCWNDISGEHHVHEAQRLNLSINKAASLLHWHPIWNFKKTLAHTMEWYCSHHQKKSDALALTREQITSYMTDAREAALVWPNDNYQRTVGSWEIEDGRWKMESRPAKAGE